MIKFNHRVRREREREKTFDEECKMTAEVMLVVKSLYQFINNLLEFIALFNVEPFFADNKTNKQKTTTLYSFTSVVTNFIVRYLTLNVSLQNNKPQSTPSTFLLTRNCHRWTYLTANYYELSVFPCSFCKKATLTAAGFERTLNHAGPPQDERKTPRVNTHFENLLTSKTIPKSDLQTQSKHKALWEVPQPAIKVTLHNEVS